MKGRRVSTCVARSTSDVVGQPVIEAHRPSSSRLVDHFPAHSGAAVSNRRVAHLKRCDRMDFPVCRAIHRADRVLAGQEHGVMDVGGIEHHPSRHPQEFRLIRRELRDNPMRVAASGPPAGRHLCGDGLAFVVGQALDEGEVDVGVDLRPELAVAGFVPFLLDRLQPRDDPHLPPFGGSE